MSPKKKNEPELYHEHPYLPSDIEEIFGFPVAWLPKGTHIDWVMEPDPETGPGTYFKKEYRGRCVATECDKDAYPTDPVIFIEDGQASYTLSRLVIEEWQKLKERADRLADDNAEYADDLEKANEAAVTMKEQLKEMEELCRAQQADLEHWQAEAGKTPDSTSDSLHAAIGGSPKEVQIKW